MAFTEFCCRSGGSNLNAGTLTGNSTEPGTSASFTYASGNWVQSTGVFTVASGDPASDGVAVGDFASVYADGSTVTGFVGRVTACDATTITVSLTAKAGTAPTDGTGNRTLKVGGAWLGPNAAEQFPFNFATGALTNSAGDPCRVNLKNDAQYDITAGINHSLIGPVTFQGYTTAYGDLGKFTIDGGTSGASYVLFQLTSNGVDRTQLLDFLFKNNGATGSADALGGIADPRTLVARGVVHDVRGAGFPACNAIECEAYACNQSNTSLKGGFANGGSNGTILMRCISHDNVGSNSSGFYSQGSSNRFIDCIADSNESHGFHVNNVTSSTLQGCDAYNNGGDGFRHITANTQQYFENCNFISNGGYGINYGSSTIANGAIVNCGFYNNTSGAKNNTDRMHEIGTVTYSAVPYVDAANGDFRISSADAKGAGRGSFTQTAASYTGTVGYPDIGAAQHQDAGGGGSGGAHILGGTIIR